MTAPASTLQLTNQVGTCRTISDKTRQLHTHVHTACTWVGCWVGLNRKLLAACLSGTKTLAGLIAQVKRQTPCSAGGNEAPLH